MEIQDLTKEAVLISEESTFKHALESMVVKQTNVLLVTNTEGELTGTVDVSDLLNAIVPVHSDPENILDELSTEKGFSDAVVAACDIPVIDFMNVDVEPVHVKDTLITIASTALTHQVENIPIIDHANHPIGIISRRGIKHILAQYLGIKDIED